MAHEPTDGGATTYVCLIRGINVGGRRRVPMAELRAVIQATGLSRVDTYLQSGNVLFDAAVDTDNLAETVAGEIAREFGFDIPVIVLKGSRLSALVRHNPFVNRGTDPAALHLTFLERTPDDAHLEWLHSFDPDPEALVVRGDAVYLYCPNGYSRTRLSNTFLERRFDVAATTRNWKTVTALEELVRSR